MSALLSIIWILLGLSLQAVKSQSFISPRSTGIYPLNQAVPVAVMSTSFHFYVLVSMKCGAITSSEFILTENSPTVAIMPPTNYIGQCAVSGKDNNGVSMTPVTIQITRMMYITSPSTTYPYTKYPAGNSLFVSWTYDPPTASSSTTVSLNCEGSGAGTSETISFSLSGNLTISTDSYGYDCILSLTPSNTSYVLSRTVGLAVSQQLSFSDPINENSYSLSNSSTIPVLLITEPSTSPSTQVNLLLQCVSGGDSTSSVMTNSMVDYDIPAEYYGPCTLTPLLDSPDQDYLVLPTTAMSFYLKYNLTFASITSSPAAGGPFSFQLNSNPLPAVSQTVDVSLICNNIANQIWPSVPVNVLYTTNLNADAPAGVDCILQTSAVNDYYFQATSDSFIISANPITITSPSAGGKLASGSSFDVTWTTSSTPPDGTVYNVFLACPEFSTISSNTASLSASLSIPSINYGDGCTVIVAATGFSTAQVSVVVTQILSFETPTDGSVIALTTSSIPLKLVTSGANVYANVSVSFQCAGEPATSSSFAANTDSLTQSVSSSQIGSCSLTITSAPAYLVYSSPSVSFTLKYSLTFMNLPAILYRGQSFTIRIDTVTPASAPPSVTLYLICPAGVVSSSWSGVLINQANNLLLSSTTPLVSCYFNVNSDATYTQAISSNVPVGKVPVSVSLPSGPGPFPKPLAVPLLVNTTVTPVNGTVNLQSTCSSLTAPFTVSIPINTLGPFSYPQNAYGVCNLAVVDEVFEQLPTNIS